MLNVMRPHSVSFKANPPWDHFLGLFIHAHKPAHLDLICLGSTELPLIPIGKNSQNYIQNSPNEF